MGYRLLALFLPKIGVLMDDTALLGVLLRGICVSDIALNLRMGSSNSRLFLCHLLHPHIAAWIGNGIMHRGSHLRYKTYWNLTPPENIVPLNAVSLVLDLALECFLR